MPPTAKQYKTKSPKTGSDTSGKETDESPAKLKVISGQLQRSMRKKRKVRKGKGPVNSTRGVVFVKNLPHGFFEEQLQKYFQQFGKVTKVRLARSLKTGGSKGFAFIEFAIPEVAEIAADTMNNYLMFRKIVKAAYIPPEEQKYNYFRTSLRKVQNKHGKEMYVSATTKRTTKKVIEMNNWTAENYAKRMKRTHSKLNALKRNLSHLGYDAESVVLQTENSSPVKDDIAATNGSTAPVSKKQKRSKSTSGESNHSLIQNTDTEPSPTKSASAITPDKTTKEQSKIKLPVRPKAAGTLRRLLDSTIEDNSSSDDDFVPNEESVMTDESSEADDSESAVYEHGLKLEKGKQNPLISLLNETIPDEDSSDDEFDPTNEIDNLPIETSEEEEDDDEESDEDEEDDDEESSPSKTDKKFRKETERKLDKIGQKKLNGGVHKKVKVQKPVKSLALKQKIQESVKEMAKQNKVTKLKEKNLKKGKKRGL